MNVHMRSRCIGYDRLQSQAIGFSKQSYFVGRQLDMGFQFGVNGFDLGRFAGQVPEDAMDCGQDSQITIEKYPPI